jgi:hypothetical protein
MDPVARPEEHKIQTLQELPRLLDPRESHSDQTGG